MSIRLLSVFIGPQKFPWFFAGMVMFKVENIVKRSWYNRTTGPKDSVRHSRKVQPPQSPNMTVKLPCTLVRCHESAINGNSRGVTKTYRQSWLTNSALVYEPKCGGRGRVAGSQPMCTAVHRSPNKLWRSNSIHCKKRLAVFPSQAGMSLTKLSLGGNNKLFPGYGEFGKWHPGWGRENRLPFFTVYLTYE